MCKLKLDILYGNNMFVLWKAQLYIIFSIMGRYSDIRMYAYAFDVDLMTSDQLKGDRVSKTFFHVLISIILDKK